MVHSRCRGSWGQTAATRGTQFGILLVRRALCNVSVRGPLPSTPLPTDVHTLSPQGVTPGITLRSQPVLTPEGCHHVPALECSAHPASAQLRARGPPVNSQGCVEGTAAARGVQFDIYRWRERSSVARASEVPTFGAALSRCTRRVSIGCNTRERTAEPAALTLESCRHVPALAAHTSLRPVKSERPSCQFAGLR